MKRTVLIDGQVVAPEEARVSIFDRGFMYGDSVFESLRCYGGVPFALDRHLARLERSAARVFISLPVTLDVLHEEVERALSLHAGSECYVRLMLTRGVGRALGLDPELAEYPLRVLLVSELLAPPREIYERGIAAITFRAERPSDAAAVNDAKTGNYLLAILAMRAARASGAQEALLEDGSARILEGSTSNVFAVSRGTLLTPPESLAILPGITRAHVIELALAAGMNVEQRAISKTELSSFDELFVCSSLRELVPVVKIDGHEVASGAPGPVTLELLRLYRERVAGA